MGIKTVDEMCIEEMGKQQYLQGTVVVWLTYSYLEGTILYISVIIEKKQTKKKQTSMTCVRLCCITFIENCMPMPLQG